jgi:hypothetical protein
MGAAVDSDPETTAIEAYDRGPVRKPWVPPLIEQSDIAETEIAKVGVVAEGGTSIS